jgi:hypothetical protein
MLSQKDCCSIIGCDKPVKAKFMCEKHYARVLRHGTVKVKFERGSVKTCLAINCFKSPKSYGYCDYHGGLIRDIGTPYKPTLIKFCSLEGCERPHQARGLCGKHYNKAYEYYDSHGHLKNKFKIYPYKPKVISLCGIKGCENPHHVKGICLGHYTEWQKIESKYGLTNSDLPKTPISTT